MPGEGDHPNACDGPERCPPPCSLAQQGAERNAQHVGRGQPGEHQRDGAGLPGGGNHVRGHHRADAEERAVGKGRDDPAGHHGPVVRRGGGEQVAGDEQDQQGGQHRFTVEPGERCRESEGADHHGQRIAGDEPAGCGFTDGKVRRHFRQQSHDDEFGESDPEPSEGEGYASQQAWRCSFELYVGWKRRLR